MAFNSECFQPNFEENASAIPLPCDGYGVRVGDFILYTGPALYSKALIPNNRYRINEIDTTRKDPYRIENALGNVRWVGYTQYFGGGPWYMLVKSGNNNDGAEDKGSEEMGLLVVQFKDIKPNTTLTWIGESDQYFTQGDKYCVKSVDCGSRAFAVEINSGRIMIVYANSSIARSLGVVDDGPTPITVTLAIHGDNVELSSEHSIKLSDGGAKQLFDELVATITK